MPDSLRNPVSTRLVALLALAREGPLAMRNLFWSMHIATFSTVKGSNGALYPAIAALVREGLAEPVRVHRERSWRGRTGKHYRITPLGRAVLEATLLDLEDFLQDAARVIATLPRPGGQQATALGPGGQQATALAGAAGSSAPARAPDRPAGDRSGKNRSS